MTAGITTDMDFPEGFADTARLFLGYISIERGLAAATVKAYESDLRRYTVWLGEKGILSPQKISEKNVEQFVAQLSQEGESQRSIARRLASIHEYHRYL
ncbi:MAG: site-specific integrase, partial [Scardovia wiggsiae]